MTWARGATIGHGTFATVSLAFVDDNVVVVAKSAPLSTSWSLRHEEPILSELRHCPRIVSCLGHDITTEAGGERFYNLFLEYFPNGSLHDLVRLSGGSLPESKAKRYAKSILEGLKFIHDRGYVHCDIKLKNVLVGHNEGDVKIADFGMAKKAGKEESSCCIRGTPIYMSPESVARKEYEAPMDIWAVGCAVAEMVSGRPPWQTSGEDAWALMMRIGFGDEAMEIPQEMSEKGKDFLRKCFVRDPEKRWTADMLLNHPFLAEVEELGGAIRVRNYYCSSNGLQSPMSVLHLSPFSSTTVNFGSAADRVRLLATGRQPDWWHCSSSEDVWIKVREAEG